MSDDSRRAVTWLDVFTSQPLTGNALCVIHGADDLSDGVMLAVARETRLSETTFIQQPTVTGADYRNRIFSPPGELPFAGHPSLGTAVAHARHSGKRTASYVQQTRAGLQPIEVELHGATARASMIQGPVTYGATPDPERVAAAFGLQVSDLVAELPPTVASAGAPHLLTVIADASRLPHLEFQPAALGAILDELEVIVIYVVAVSDDGTTVRARSFYMDRGLIVEDPATGSAAGPLVAFLARGGVTSSIEISQGVEMGRPSRLAASVVTEQVGFVRVGGDAVVVADATGVL
ncbi:MAG: PhzF family phenazine biosynthesis protein [Solirubrobacteraceae bacterium]|nr:PhzF family phenazine biosynthesis protein [Solirubrobacteraceae bacterium]